MTGLYRYRYSPGMVEVSELLRDARRDAGLSQHALANRAGTSQPAVARYESGVSTPTVSTLRRLLAATGRDLVLSSEPVDSRALDGPTGRRVTERREAVLEVLREHGAWQPRIFGSVARGEDRADSDLDLLVELPRPDYIGLGELRAVLEGLLGVPVDLVVPQLLRPEVLARAIDEAVAL